MTDEELKALIADKAKSVEKHDHFALLGVTQQTPKGEIAKAYFELAKVLHPDRVSKRGLKEQTAAANAVFAALSEAQSVLSDPKRRDDYQRQHPMAGASAEEIQARVASQSTQELLRKDVSELGISAKEASKIFFHKGVTLLKKGAFSESEQMLERALDGDPDNARYHLQMGWAVFQNTARPDGKRLATARTHLEKAVAGDMENPEAHYYMARLWRETGDNDKCRQSLLKALEKRPSFIEAKRELRLLEMRGLVPTKGGAEVKPSSAAQRPASKAGTKPSGARSMPGKDEAPPTRWPFGLDRLFRKK